MARMNCDSCNASVTKPVYCCVACRVKAYRKRNASVTNTSEVVTIALQDRADMLRKRNETVTVEVQDEYIAPTAPCAFCGKTLQYDDECEGFPCRKCRQVTRLRAE